MVAKLPTGKIALVHQDHAGAVKPGERWLVRLEHRLKVAIAHPLERLPSLPSADPAPPSSPVMEELGEPLPWPLEFVSPGERVAIFVDGPNLEAASKLQGASINHKKLRKVLRGEGKVYGAFLHTGDWSAAGFPQQTRFLDVASKIGYTVRLKAVRESMDPSTGLLRQRCNVGSELTVEIITTMPHWDVGFVLSGDNDLAAAVTHARAHGKRVYVASFRAQLGRDLAFAADKPILVLDDLLDHLRRAETEPVAPPDPPQDA